MILRQHQQQIKSVVSDILAGRPIRTIYCQVTPGGGKSLLPIVAGRLITTGRADKMIWIAPRLSLTDQAEREFINPRFRDLLQHNLKIRSSTNEPNPCRGLDGFSTTYNAVGLDDGTLVSEFERQRYILVCDEFHHIQEKSLWHKKIQPLYERAAFRVMMSGTLERGDGTRIAFMPYRMNGSGKVPDLRDTDDTAVIRYSRSDALRERAIIPLSFHLTDGQAEWEQDGKRVRIASMDKTGEDMAARALYTALHTEFADELLMSGLSHWSDHRLYKNPNAKALVVCSNIEQARRHTKNLKAQGFRFRFEIATSEDSSQALKAIKKMKAGKLDALITVAMAYEGLDIPSVSHLICLTRIRSAPWIEQMTARANRIDPDGGPYDQQFGYVFAPADALFKDIVSRIESEQLPVLEERKREKRNREPGDGDLFGGLFGPKAPGGIKPLASRMTDKREVLLNGNGNGCTPELTASEHEANLLESIENHIRIYAFNNRFNPKKLNTEVFIAFGKPRRELTIPELRECLRHVQEKYPINQIRGTGRPRVSTKAQPINCTWRTE